MQFCIQQDSDTWKVIPYLQANLYKLINITRLKYFYDTLNTVVILAPSRELLSAKCDQFPLTFTERN